MHFPEGLENTPFSSSQRDLIKTFYDALEFRKKTGGNWPKSVQIGLALPYFVCSNLTIF